MTRAAKWNDLFSRGSSEGTQLNQPVREERGAVSTALTSPFDNH
jgi:hypothetical protein